MMTSAVSGEITSTYGRNCKTMHLGARQGDWHGDLRFHLGELAL